MSGLDGLKARLRAARDRVAALSEIVGALEVCAESCRQRGGAVALEVLDGCLVLRVDPGAVDLLPDTPTRAPAVVWTPERDAALVAAYRAGTGLDAIAAELGMIPSAPRNRITRLRASGAIGPEDVRVRDAAGAHQGPGSGWSDEDVQRLRALRAEGVRLVDIATLLGRSPGSVSGKLSQMARAGHPAPAGPSAPGSVSVEDTAAAGQMRRWTPSEDLQVLESRIGTGADQALARALARRPAEVRVRRAFLSEALAPAELGAKIKALRAQVREANDAGQ